MCNVYRNELGKDQKDQSFGLLVTFLSCNVVIEFTKSIKSEGCRRLTVEVVDENMNNYSKACSFYERAVDIAQHSLPSDHPNLQKWREHLEKVKKKL